MDQQPGDRPQVQLVAVQRAGAAAAHLPRSHQADPQKLPQSGAFKVPHSANTCGLRELVAFVRLYPTLCVCVVCFSGDYYGPDAGVDGRAPQRRRDVLRKQHPSQVCVSLDGISVESLIKFKISFSRVSQASTIHHTLQLETLLT